MSSSLNAPASDTDNTTSPHSDPKDFVCDEGFEDKEIDLNEQPLNIFTAEQSQQLLKWQEEQWCVRFPKIHAQFVRSENYKERQDKKKKDKENEQEKNSEAMISSSSGPTEQIASNTSKTDHHKKKSSKLTITMDDQKFKWSSQVLPHAQSFGISDQLGLMVLSGGAFTALSTVMGRDVQDGVATLAAFAGLTLIKTAHLLTTRAKDIFKNNRQEKKSTLEHFSYYCNILGKELKTYKTADYTTAFSIVSSIVVTGPITLAKRWLPESNQWDVNDTTDRVFKWVGNNEKWRVSSRLELMNSTCVSDDLTLYARVADLHRLSRWHFVGKLCEEMEKHSATPNAEQFSDPKMFFSPKELESWGKWNDKLKSEYALRTVIAENNESMLTYLEQWMEQAQSSKAKPWFKPRPDMPSLTDLLEDCIRSLSHPLVTLPHLKPDYKMAIEGLRTVCEAEEIRSYVGVVGELTPASKTPSADNHSSHPTGDFGIADSMGETEANSSTKKTTRPRL